MIQLGIYRAVADAEFNAYFTPYVMLLVIPFTMFPAIRKGNNTTYVTALHALDKRRVGKDHRLESPLMAFPLTSLPMDAREETSDASSADILELLGPSR